MYVLSERVQVILIVQYNIVYQICRFEQLRQDIVKMLAEQMVSPVLWELSMQQAISDGCTEQLGSHQLPLVSSLSTKHLPSLDVS